MEFCKPAFGVIGGHARCGGWSVEGYRKMTVGVTQSSEDSGQLKAQSRG